MELAAAVFMTDRTMPPGDLAAAVEDRGLAALYVPEHTHIPVDHDPYPAGGELPEMYKRTLDPFITLTAAAAATDEIEVATGICLAAQHHPINLAKQTASIDHLSGGRFVLGVGFGWNRPEAEHHGVDWDRRRERVRETVEAVTALWTQETPAYDGEQVRFAPSWSWPKPVRSPRPPVVLGAAFGERTLEDLVGWCDGWLPIGASGLRDDLPRLRSALEAAGRDPDAFTVTVYGTRRDPDRLDYLRSLGIDRVCFWLPSAGADEVLPELDEIAKLRDHLR